MVGLIPWKVFCQNCKVFEIDFILFSIQHSTFNIHHTKFNIQQINGDGACVSALLFAEVKIYRSLRNVPSFLPHDVQVCDSDTSKPRDEYPVSMQFSSYFLEGD